eukprot:gb/GEZN01009392.1/.p1 GENE.gb/GEZN01009392.1/~~gb/GEZN01009392.1/.p1  ORF type:complete len:376 (-),score=15.69 gb/GEZN01009392.1/:203-1306(-)
MVPWLAACILLAKLVLGSSPFMYYGGLSQDKKIVNENFVDSAVSSGRDQPGPPLIIVEPTQPPTFDSQRNYSSITQGARDSSRVRDSKRHPWRLHEMANPLIEPYWCGRTYPSHVCNPDGIVKDGQIKIYETILEDIAKVRPLMLGGSYCSLGYQMYLAIVHNIELPYNKPLNSAAVEFAENLLEDWGAGDPVCQNGIVFLFDAGDRIMAMATGKGAQIVLTYDKIHEIYESMKPALRMEDWERALTCGLRSTRTVLQGGVLEPERDNSAAFLNGIWLILVLVIICCVWQSCTEHCYEGADDTDSRQGDFPDWPPKHRLTEREYGSNGGLARYPDYHGEIAEPYDEYLHSNGTLRQGDLGREAYHGE